MFNLQIVYNKNDELLFYSGNYVPLAKPPSVDSEVFPSKKNIFSSLACETKHNKYYA